MKRAILIVFVISLSMLINTEAATTGINPTQYDYTISNPNPAKDESITIDTHVEIWETDHFVDMYQGMGEMRHYLLQYDSDVGSVQSTGNYEYDLSSTLEYDFTLTEDKSIYAIKIPLSIDTDDSQFVTGTSITVQLYQDTNYILTFDIIDWEIMSHLAENDGLMIPINTVYTIMSQYHAGLLLSKDTSYTLKFDFLNFPSGTIVNIPADPGYSSEISLVAGTVQAFTPGFVMYSGIKLGETRTAANGIHTMDLSMDYGSYFYLATFFDEMTNWQRFMYINEFDIVDVSNPYIDASDATFDYGDNLFIVATAKVNIGGALLVNQPINLFERDGAVYDLVSTLITNTMGQVSFALNHINDAGSHEFLLETWYNGKRATKLTTITINEPMGEYIGLQAVGYFSSAGIDSTRVTIEGYAIQQSSSNPVVGGQFEIFKNSILIQTVITDSTGFFAFDMTMNDAVGVYTSLMSIHYSGDVWGIGDAFFDLQILKGMPTIDMVDVQTGFSDQPFSFIGFVTDMSIIPLQVDATLEYYDSVNDVWIPDGSVTVLPDGSLSGTSTTIMDAGQYVYQIRTVQNSNFRSITKAFNVLIDSTQITISRGGLADPYYVEYHENGDFSVFVLDNNLFPVEGVSMRFSTNDIVQGTIIDLATVITDETGLASLNWVVPDGNLALIYAPIDMIVSYVGSTNYETYDFTFEYFLVPTNLEATINPGVTEFNSISTITIDINDNGGFDTKEGIDFVVDIDGSVYNLVSDVNGKLIFSHEYDLVGMSTFSISYDRDTQLVENGYETYLYTEQISIDKGTFNIVMDDLYVSQGSLYDLNIYVEDINLDPVEGVAVEVLLYNNIEWISILTGSTSPTGIVTSNLLAEMAPGIYSYKVIIAEGNQYFGASDTKLFVITDISTKIVDIVVPSTYYYGSADTDRYVELQLVIDNLNIPLAGKTLHMEYGGQIFTNITDAEGKISFHLTQYENPGDVDLIVQFLDDGVYKTSTYSRTILVDGIDTIVNWIQLPTDTYYGEILSTSVVVTDYLGNPLDNYEVVLTINELTYSRYSDANGEVFFSIELRTDLGTTTVKMDLQAVMGYDPASIELDINHDKRDLEMDISTSSDLLETQYAYPTEFVTNPYVIIDSVPVYLTDCTIEVYWADIFGGSWILIDTISYDGNPFSVILPKQDVGVTQFLKFIAIDSDYHPKEAFIDLEIVQGPVYSDVTSSSSAYGDNITISIELRDYFSTVLPDTMVELRYVDPYTSQIVFSMIVHSDQNGIAFFEFIAFDSGVLQFDFVIGDGNGNYLQTAGTHTVSVSSRDSINMVYFESFDGRGYIYLNISDSLTGSGVSGMAEIYLYDGSDYILQQIITIDTGFAYYLLSNLDTSNDYYVLIHSMVGYDDYEEYLHLNKEHLTVDISEQTVQTQLNNPLVFTITGNTDLRGMYVIAYYYDTGTSNWVELGTLYLTNGGISLDLVAINLDLGYYDLKLYILEQIWFEEKIVFEVLHVVKKESNIVYDPINVYSNISITIVLTVIDDNSNTISGLTVELYLGNELITSSSSINGLAQLTFTLDMPLGEYSGKFIILGDDIFASSETAIIIYVWREANIDYNTIGDIVYTDGGLIAVTVTDYDTGDTINDASVSLEYKHLFEWINLGNAVSNESGIAVIYVDSIEPGSYKMRATMTQIDIYGSVSIEKTITVLPETVNIEFEQINYGISHNRTISLDIFDESDSIAVGNIYFKIMTASGLVFDQGSIDLKDTNELVIPGDLIGNYSISITYGHDKNYYVYNSELIIQNIGYDELQASDIILEYDRVDYTDTELIIQISTAEGTLAGVDVLIHSNYTGYINLRTDINGYLIIPINYTLPGEYMIRIEIISSIYLSDDFEADFEVIIERADISFEVEFPEIIYFSNGLTVDIDDLYLNSSSYEIRIISLEGEVLETSDRFNTSSYYYYFDLPTGEYVFAVVRFNDLLYDEVVKQQIAITEKPVEISIEYVVNPDSDSVDLEILALFEDESVEGITFNLTIYNGGVFHYEINSSLTVNVYGTGSMEIYASAMSPFQGEIKLIVHYDVNTVEISDTGDEVVTGDNPSSDIINSSTIIGGILSIGSAVQLKPKIFKLLGKKT